ncbi:MAG: archease [Candidatus Thermoplasmatota archaeon]|nr:archease [Candidatus Thermoplasmatota archaeon]
MKDMQPYKTFEHTADIGIQAHGASLVEAFAHAARGMFSLMVDGSHIEPREEREIELPVEGDREQLLVDWLSELLYLRDVEGLVFGDFQVSIGEETLRATVRGEPYSRERHAYGREIKAVTYHLLEIKRTKKGVYIKVLFDI